MYEEYIDFAVTSNSYTHCRDEKRTERHSMNQLKLSTILTNPRNIDVSGPFVYYIQIRDIAGGNEYRYVGKTDVGMERIERYDTNIKHIEEGKPKPSRKDGKYRAVHFVLYTALQERWEINAYPLTSCTDKEKALIEELHCNLNGKGTWHIEHLADTTIESLGVNPICSP